MYSSLSSDDDDARRNGTPNNTIMVRGLAQHIKENDIRQDISECGLVARDIRLIRKKESGNMKEADGHRGRETPDSARSHLS